MMTPYAIQRTALIDRIRALVATGDSIGAVADALNMSETNIRKLCARNNIVSQYDMRKARERNRPPGEAKRRCLGCRATFLSHGVGNRMCDRCRWAA